VSISVSHLDADVGMDGRIGVAEAVYPRAFSVSHQDCHFVCGRTFSGRYLLVLVRVLSPDEVLNLGFDSGANVITARKMNTTQRKMCKKRRMK